MYDFHHYLGHRIYALIGPGPFNIDGVEFTAPLDLEINLTSGLYWWNGMWFRSLTEAHSAIDTFHDGVELIELNDDTIDMTVWPEPEPGPKEPVLPKKSDLRRCWEVTWAMALMPVLVWTRPAGSDWRWVFRDLWDGIRGLGMLLFIFLVSIVASVTSPISGPAAFFILRHDAKKRKARAEAIRKAMDADV